MNRTGPYVDHPRQFAVYKQVASAVAFGLYISDREISSATGVSESSVGQYLTRLRRSFPSLLSEFDEIRHTNGVRKDKNADNTVQSLDEILT